MVPFFCFSLQVLLSDGFVLPPLYQPSIHFLQESGWILFCFVVSMPALFFTVIFHTWQLALNALFLKNTLLAL
jgi:hypothetical protein